MNHKPDSGQAISDVFGAVILIGVIVTVFGVAGVMLFSQPQPQKVPALDAIISSNARTIDIQHDGGDTLRFDDMQILLNGQDFTNAFKKDGTAGWSTWSVGQSLTYDIPTGDPVPSLIQIVYKGNGVSQLIASSGEGGTGSMGTLPIGAPVVMVITPDSGSVGTVVPVTDLAGSNFFTGATVTLSRAGYANIPASSVVVVSPTRITCQLNLAGSALGSWDVVVTNPGGSSGTLANGFSIVPAIPPPVADFSGTPLSGTVPLMVSFSDLSTGSPMVWSWLFGDIGGGNTSSLQNPTHTYSSGGTYTVGLTASNDGGSTTKTRIDYITVNWPAPTILSISPNSAQTDTIVTVTDLTGTGFRSGATVNLTKPGSSAITATSVNVVSSTKITCQFNLAGAAAGTWDLRVTNPDGRSGILTGGFTVTNPAPTVTGITPSTGVAGTSVPVTNLAGTNFITGTTPIVWLSKTGAGNITATGVSVVSSTRITCTLPLPTPSSTSAGQWDVTVRNTDGQTGTLTNGFTVTNPAPTVTGITPNYGLRGQTVSITSLAGTNFITGITPSVLLYKAGQTNITGNGVNVVSSTQITNTFAIPSNALMTQWDVIVINADGQQSTGGTNLFTIRRPLRIISVSPATTAKNRALTVTINGEGFLSAGTTGIKFTRNGTSTTVTGTSVTYIAETQITAYFNKPANTAAIYYDVTVTNPAPDSQVAFYPRAILTTN